MRRERPPVLNGSNHERNQQQVQSSEMSRSRACPSSRAEGPAGSAASGRRGRGGDARSGDRRGVVDVGRTTRRCQKRDSEMERAGGPDPPRLQKRQRPVKKMSFRAIVRSSATQERPVVSVFWQGPVMLIGLPSARGRPWPMAKSASGQVPLTRNQFDPHRQPRRSGAASVMMRPAPPGTGVIGGWFDSHGPLSSPGI